MMRWLLILLLVPVTAGADTRVRTAEHGPFTRVVIDYVDAPSYNLEVGSGEVQIQADEAVSYDLSDVYRRIDRTRVTRFSQGNGALVIELGCDCAVSRAELPNGGLIVDISDPDPTAPAILEPEARPELAALQEPPLEATPSSMNNSSTGSLIIPGLLTKEAAEPSPMAGRLREALIADLFDESVSGVSLAPRAKRPVIADAKTGSGEGALLGGQIAVDTRSGQYGRGARRIPAQAACAPILLQSISEWLDGPDTLDAASSNFEILKATAKQLIIGGFGAEAVAILDPSARTSDETLLYELAQLVDAPIQAPLIIAMSECSDLASLFAALADPPTPPARPGALVAAINALPKDLGHFYGDRIVEQMHRIGQFESAELVRAAAGRLDQEQAAGVWSPFNAGIGEEQRENAALEMEIARRTPDAPTAMALLIAGYVERAEPIPQDIFDQATIMLRETEDVARFDLERAMVEARIAERDVRSANALISAVAERLPEEAANLREFLAEKVLEFSSDADFLLGLALVADEPLADSKLRTGLADRALQLAMPHLTVAVLTASPNVPSRPEQILLAKAYLDRQDWAEAVDILERMTGADVDALRARLPAPAVSASVETIAEPEESVPPTIRTRSSQLVAETESLRAEWRAFLEQ